MTDRRDAMTLLASNYENDPIDVLAGDWMSEANMTARAATKVNGVFWSTSPTSSTVTILNLSRSS